MRRAAALLLLLAPAAAAQPPAGVARPVDADAARRQLGLLPDYAAVPNLRAVKVAVLDSGFDGVGGKRAYLPANAVVVEHYDPEFVRRHGLGDPAFRKPFAPGDAHGRLMAQLVWAAAGNSPDGPQFYLLNANGPTLFRRAVRYAVEQKVDVILFSATFDGAGNGDGRGPVNAAVDEATAAGIIWVNAAGNGGGLTYNGPVAPGPDGYLRFPTPDPTGLRFTNRLDENAVTVTLTWNDYRDVEDYGTDKDLDLFVVDARGAVVGQGTLRQVPAGRQAGDGETKNPRERVVIADLPAAPAGEPYRIRVKANSANFGPRDRLRVRLAAARTAPLPDRDGRAVPPVEFLDATRGEELDPPADHPGVLAVGDTSAASAVGPTADGRVKPDVVLAASAARFSNGEETAGASNAAAYFAGVVAVLRATEPGLTVGHLRAWVRQLDAWNRPAAAAPAAPPRRPQPLPEPAPLPPAGPDLAVMSAGPAGVFLSPNQARALRNAGYAFSDDRRAPWLPPDVRITMAGGSYQVLPGGGLLPVGGSAPVAPFAPGPAAVRPARPAAPTPPVTPTTPAAEAVHAPWLTPSPDALGRLVRGR